MDINTVTEVVRPKARKQFPAWLKGDSWLAGGTWLYSEPQPEVRRLIDLESLGWKALSVSEEGLSIAATCKIRELFDFVSPPEWLAAPLIPLCCHSLLASFKIWNTATVGGNVCMSLSAGAMISLTAALEGVCTIWQSDGAERRVAVVDFVTGAHTNVLKPGELLRSIDLPASALRKRPSFRRMSLTHEGRSSVLLIGTAAPGARSWALTVTASTVKPIRLEFPNATTGEQLRDALRNAISDDLYLDDVHGTPAYRKHLTLQFAEEIRRDLTSGEAK
jgi:CO/xanthine dehydrogenase FAD-binding subunit